MQTIKPKSSTTQRPTPQPSTSSAPTTTAQPQAQPAPRTIEQQQAPSRSPVSVLLGLGDRKTYAEARLNELKRQRGIALLDDEPFTGDDEILDLEIEIDSLTVAEGEAIRRERADQEAALERRRHEARREISLFEACRLDAVKRAENAATELTVALLDVVTYSTKMDRSMQALGFVCDKTPPEGIAERLSRRLTAVMRPLLSSRNFQAGYGAIEFPVPRDMDVGEWVAAEKALLAGDIEKATRATPKE